MTFLQAVLLGALQGLTEFLPVSSSGHLVLTQELLKVSHEGDISFEVFVHFGTFLSVAVALRKDIAAILLSSWRGLREPHRVAVFYKVDDFFRLAVFIIVSSVPAALIGWQYQLEVEELFSDPKLVSVMLMITGFVLYLTRFANPREDQKVGLWSSIVIGCAQAAAIIPGISRSGSTISAGLLSGISRENSAKFSFLMALPVIAGATLLKISDMFTVPPTVDKLINLAAGTVVAAVSGYGAILFLLSLLRKRRFTWFAYYCFAAGIAGVLFIG